ncbi:MAG: amidase [Gemmatimonadetes bacterium]|nr:amidase [Gemmatimonadota bacterium]
MPVNRRRVLKVLTAAGVTAPVVARSWKASAAGGAVDITPDMIRQAEWLTGLRYDDADRDLMLEDVRDAVKQWDELRGVEIDNSVVPAFTFDPAPGRDIPAGGGATWAALPDSGKRASAERGTDSDVAFASIAQLATWLERGEISARELTDLYLARLERFDPQLACVITTTAERAREFAEEADRRLAAGERIGALDGIPWGAKDLLAVSGYRTTWGAKPYENQTREETAAVVQRLDDAGAVLLAKLSVGALAWGDVWFGGTTKNPWNPEQGSSGSSAGPASATAAGLVGFAIGTETWGSILSPSTRCGLTGLRPTFGTVSRHGCMALTWTMDKIGPMARSAEDCAWIFDAIRGRDPRDPASRDSAFSWPSGKRAERLRVGFIPSLFEEERPQDDEEAPSPQAVAAAREWDAIDRRTLKELEGMGIDLIPMELPTDVPVGPLALILTAEATAAFDDLTRSGRDDLLVRQERYAWPNVFRRGQLIPAVEYIRANRIRTHLVAAWERMFEKVDVFVAPTYGGDNLLATNLTGHPQLVLPNGFRESDGTPTSITFTGRLFGEEDLLAIGAAYQQATDYHRKRPAGF